MMATTTTAIRAALGTPGMVFGLTRALSVPVENSIGRAA